MFKPFLFFFSQTKRKQNVLDWYSFFYQYLKPKRKTIGTHYITLK
jgi:hypothetical protein